MQNLARKEALHDLKRPLKALIVNDSLLQRVSLGKMCALAGFQVLEATGEDNLLDYIEREQVDLVVCDSQVGEHDGLEVCATIRAAKLEFFVYFLLLSPHLEEGYAIKALEAGADEHLPKPLNKQEFAVRMVSAQRAISLQKSYYATRADLPMALQDLSRDMRAMSNFQRSQLPKRRSVVHGLQLDYLWIPKVFVSGDLFDVFKLDDQYVSFYLLDVVGHGVPSALKVMNLSQLMSAHPKEGILLESVSGGYGHRVRPPSEVLGLMNKRFQMRSDTDVFFFMMYGLFNLHTGEVTVSMAGSPLPLVQGLDGALNELGMPSFPIGVIEDDTYSDYSCKLEAGMRLFICSDGLTQIRDAEDIALDVQGVAALIAQGADKTLSQQIDSVRSGLAHWVSGKNTDRLYEDDATLLALQWRNKGDDDLVEEMVNQPPPIAEEIEQAEAQQISQAEQEDPAFKFHPRKESSTVLLWADQKANTDLPAWLGEWGYVPSEKRTRAEILAATKQLHYTFLVVDLQTFKEVDEAFIQGIREGLNPTIYVLLLTNAHNRDSLLDALSAGADNCTQVDYSAREIYTRLGTGLRLAQIHQTMAQESASASALRADIEEDMLRIAKMQVDNLPKPVDEGLALQFSLFLKPKGLVSSHYMNVMKLSDGSLAFFHLTSEGEGLVGAARGLSVFRQLNNAAFDRNSMLSQFMGEHFSPAAILRELNSQMLQSDVAGETCALCYGVLNPDTGAGRVSHAGYPLNVITRAKGDAEQLGAYGSTLGVSVDSQYQDVFFTLNPGDRLFVFPPDLNLNPMLNGGQFENPVEFLESTLNSTRQEIVKQLGALCSRQGEMTEDQSMLIFQFGEYVPLQTSYYTADALAYCCKHLAVVLGEAAPQASACLAVTIPNNSATLPEVVTTLEKALMQWNVGEDHLGAFQLVVFELVSNVCRHGNLLPEDTFELQALKLDTGVLIVVMDSGSEVPQWLLDCAQSHDYDFDVENDDEIPTGGLGLPLINSLSTRFVYKRHGGVNHACAWFDTQAVQGDEGAA